MTLAQGPSLPIKLWLVVRCAYQSPVMQALLYYCIYLALWKLQYSLIVHVSRLQALLQVFEPLLQDIKERHGPVPIFIKRLGAER